MKALVISSLPACAALVASALAGGCASGHGSPASGSALASGSSRAAGSGPGSSALSRSASAPAPPSGTASGRSPGASPGAAASGVFGRVLQDPRVTVAGGGLYVSWDRGEEGRPGTVLARVDPATGGIEATHAFAPGYVSRPLAADGALWVTSSSGTELVRLSPSRLAVTGTVPLASKPVPAGDDHLAFAGGSLWTDGSGKLLRVSPSAMTVTSAISLPGAYYSGVAASGDGRVLVVSEADSGGAGSVQRRDPATGAVRASHPVTGVVAPSIGGVSGSYAWVSEATGMMGYVQRFSDATMRPGPVRAHGTNAITASLAEGALWITDSGGAKPSYCADPATGAVRTHLALPAASTLLAVGDGRVYYDAPAPHGAGFTIRFAAIPAACR